MNFYSAAATGNLCIKSLYTISNFAADNLFINSTRLKKPMSGVDPKGFYIYVMLS